LRELIPNEVYIPPPEAATAAVAEDENGVLKGCLLLQLQFHMEPLVIRDPVVKFNRLVGVLDAAMVDRGGLTYYCFSDSEKVDRMAQLSGFRKLPFTVWEKEV
jgi:hypothetical protein